jgi:hypothetical protein
MIRMLIDLLLTPLFWLMGAAALVWLGRQLAQWDANQRLHVAAA